MQLNECFLAIKLPKRYCPIQILLPWFGVTDGMLAAVIPVIDLLAGAWRFFYPLLRYGPSSHRVL